MTPRFFKSPVAFRRWLAAHHARAKELEVGFYKKGSGKPGITYPEALDEALCVGWIDGVRHSLGDEGYTIRFTPRRAGSYWSAVNVRHANRLIKDGRMQPAGLAEFERRDPAKTKYIYEREAYVLAPAFEREFRANRDAWAFFQAQPPGYKRLAIGFIMQAKLEATRRRRFDAIVSQSAKGQRFRWM